MKDKKKAKATIICFTGIDGSGKSTLAKTLVAELEQCGIESQYLYNRIEPLLTRPFVLLGKVLFFGGHGQKEDYRRYATTRAKVFGNRYLAIVYQFLILADYWWQMLLRMIKPLRLGKTIVCDRYIYDTVVNLAVDLNYSEDRMGKVLDRFSRLLPRPALVFVMDVPEEIALQRKDDTPALEYLKERRELYLYLGKKCGAIVLDGTKDLQELEGKIRDNVLERVMSSE